MLTDSWAPPHVSFPDDHPSSPPPEKERHPMHHWRTPHVVSPLKSPTDVVAFCITRASITANGISLDKCWDQAGATEHSHTYDERVDCECNTQLKPTAYKLQRGSSKPLSSWGCVVSLLSPKFMRLKPPPLFTPPSQLASATLCSFIPLRSRSDWQPLEYRIFAKSRQG
jgi:hypothetical protein